MEHVEHLLSDYVLGLLPSEERQVVERHVATCRGCRAALAAEREIGAAVRLAVADLPPLPAVRRRRLMPPPPTRRLWPALSRAWAGWLQPVAAVGVMMLLVLGVFSFQAGSPAVMAISATSTSTLTLTTTATNPAVTMNSPMAPALAATPPPTPTQLAQLEIQPAPAPPPEAAGN